MGAKDFCLEQEAGNIEESTLLLDPFHAEDALSLCDLPIYSDAARWDDEFSKEDGHSSSQSNNNDDDNDFFEFFSEDFTASTSAITEKNIIFCGKIIPCKESSPIPPKGHNFESNVNSKHSNAQKGVLLPSTQNSLDNAKPSSKRVKYCDGSLKKGQEVKGSKDFICDYSIRTVSPLRSATKSKWYLFMFGKSKLPTEMQLRDIRSRQSRRGPTTLFPAPEQEELPKSKGMRHVKGLWRMLRFLV